MEEESFVQRQTPQRSRAGGCRQQPCFLFAGGRGGAGDIEVGVETAVRRIELAGRSSWLAVKLSVMTEARDEQTGVGEQLGAANTRRC